MRILAATREKKESFEAIEGVINAYGDAGFKQFLNGPAGDDVRLANFLRWVGLKTGSGKEGSILGKGTDGSSPNNEENSGLGRYASLFGPKQISTYQFQLYAMLELEGYAYKIRVT